MKDTGKIAVVIVTFNRKNLLQECLKGVFEQTKIVDHIFLVDNASSDGTDVYSKEVLGDNPLITYIRLGHNTGSAGGFHEGVQAAYKWGAEWIWFLDDDVSPEADCLEKLLLYRHISHCIHPSKKDSVGKEFIGESLFDPSSGKTTFLSNISFTHGKEFAFVNIGCFEGMIIHRDIVSHIGFPDKRFFMISDDMIYGFLASLYTNVIFVKDAGIKKLIPFNQDISPTFLYYFVRNQFLVKEYLKKYSLYNRGLFNLYFVSFIIYASIKHTIRNRSLKTPFYIWKGLLHGVMKKFYKIS